MISRLKRWLPAVVITMVLAGLGAVTLGAATEQHGQLPKVFRTGFLQNVFADTDPRDAKIVLEMHSREIARDLGLNLTAKVVFFSDIGPMLDAIRNGELELASLPSLDYLRIRKKVSLIPSFVGTNIANKGIHYLVITRKDSGISSFAELKGRSILLPPAATYEPARLWLDVLLLKEGKERRDAFFGQVKESPKISKAIMGVFFRQADAAIVTRSGFDVSRQLNPQLDAQLMVLAESPNLCDLVVCMLPGTSKKFRDDLSRSVIRLNDTKTGRQMYTIFQSGGMALFKPEYLDGLEELLREHDRLLARKSKR